MKEFKFIERFNLASYSDVNEPLIVFGVYHAEDDEIIRKHKGKLIIWWMGVDSRNIRDVKLFQQPKIFNISMMQNIIDLLSVQNIKCYLTRPFRLRGDQNRVIKGSKVYVYINKRKPEYYGLSLIKSLNIPFEVLIANYSIPQDDWYGGQNDKYFSQCFVGLALSEYAGGGSSIIECGLKGLKCITNLINMPNTIRWQTKKNIEDAIKLESQKIGTIDNELSKNVYDYIYVNIKNGFDLNIMLN